MHLAQISGVNGPSTVFLANSYATLPSLVTSRFLLFSIFVAGLIFFVRLLLAGFALMTASGEPAKIQTATKSLTHALIGLIVVVAAFFIAQIIETVFGLNIL